MGEFERGEGVRESESGEDMREREWEGVKERGGCESKDGVRKRVRGSESEEGVRKRGGGCERESESGEVVKERGEGVREWGRV